MVSSEAATTSGGISKSGTKAKRERPNLVVMQETVKEPVVYGVTPEIDQAFTLCVDEIWQTQTIEKSTSMIRREEIGSFIKSKL